MTLDPARVFATLERHGVDYLNDVPGAGDYDDLRARSVEATAAGVVVRVVGLDDLIRMKRASGRPQDLRDIANLSPPTY